MACSTVFPESVWNQGACSVTSNRLSPRKPEIGMIKVLVCVSMVVTVYTWLTMDCSLGFVDVDTSEVLYGIVEDILRPLDTVPVVQLIYSK